MVSFLAVPPTGIERPQILRRNTGVHASGDVNSDAFAAATDPDVREIAFLWESLPQAIRNAVLALVRSCREADGIAKIDRQ
jgi:hypothetical protein